MKLFPPSDAFAIREGNGDGEGNGDAAGKGSPTRFTVGGARGLRRDRMVEETDGGADGFVAIAFLATSNLGNTPAGAPAWGRLPLLCSSVSERRVLAKTSGEINETTR